MFKPIYKLNISAPFLLVRLCITIGGHKNATDHLKAHMYENLLCPVGPHDKNKAHHADAPELYENIELPVSTPQDDPYGGDGCKCDCHNQIEESKLKEINEHCASCGTRFLNGRIYLQTSEGLRPAKITFPGADNEKLENISRVSLKTIDQLVPCPPTRRRRKSSKYDSMSEECGAKLGLSKRSPAKDSEYNDRLRTKSKKGIKSPLKSTDQRKIPKIQTALMKGKREKRTEKKDTSSEQKVDYQNELYRVHDEFNEASNKFRESHDSLDDEKRISPINVSSMEKLNTSSDTDSSTNLEAEVIPWTMQEDKILLENVQKDYSKKTLIAVSILLKNRSVEQVKDRCKYLLSLIEKMT